MATTKIGEITARDVWPYLNISEQGRCNEIAPTRLRTDYTEITHGYLMSPGFQPYCDDS